MSDQGQVRSRTGQSQLMLKSGVVRSDSFRLAQFRVGQGHVKVRSRPFFQG